MADRKRIPARKTIGMKILRVEENREYRVHAAVEQQTAAVSQYIRTRTVLLSVMNMKRGR